MSNNQLFANGRVAVLSTKLFGADKFARLAECSCLAEALKVLAENGYGNGVTVSNPNDYENVLRAELDLAMALLKELCFDKYALQYLLCKYDYVNAKVLLKSKYMRIDGADYCFNNATYNPQDMQNAMVQDDYSMLTPNMAQACDSVDMQFASGVRTPQIVDVTLDKAMYADMRIYANKSSLPVIRQMHDWQLNTVNLMCLYRVKQANLPKQYFEQCILSGGSLSTEILLKLWDNDSASADLAYEYKQFYSLCKSDNDSLAQAEKQQRARVLQLMQDNGDLLSVLPVLQYYFAKTEEIDKIRHLLVGIKNGTDKDKLKDIVK